MAAISPIPLPYRLRRPAPGRGFTIVELLVTVAVAVILASLAGPSFSRLIAQQRVKNTASELYAALGRTRSEAIARNASVTLAQKTGGWQNGWQILDPSDGTTAIDDRNGTSGMAISGPASVVFSPSGRIQGGSAPMFVFTSPSDSSVAECVSVDLGGRPYMKAATSC